MKGYDSHLETFQGERAVWLINRPFGLTLKKLSLILRRPSLVKTAILVRLKRKGHLEDYLKDVAGKSGLMILGTIPHGKLLGILGGPTESQLFLLGNPLIALNLMRVHAEAGVYAPLRVMFVAGESSQTVVTYDRPSRVFAQWEEAIFRSTGELLDEKMTALIHELSL